MFLINVKADLHCLLPVLAVQKSFWREVLKEPRVSVGDRFVWLCILVGLFVMRKIADLRCGHRCVGVGDPIQDPHFVLAEDLV